MEPFGCLTNITYSLNPNSKDFNNFYYLIQLIMFFVTLLGISFIGAFFYAMYCFPPFHLNLQLLMVNFFVSYGSLTVGRLINLIAAYNCPANKLCFVSEMLLLQDSYYSELIKYISMIAFVTASYWVIGERTWATIYLKGYEHKSGIRVILGIIVIQWALAALVIYLFFYGYIPVLALIIILVVTSVTFLLIYHFMQNINRRRYRHSKKFGNAFTLSERYQLAENIQTGPVVMTLLIVSVLLHNLHLISVAIMHYSSDINTKLIGKLLFELLFTIDPMAFSIPLLLSVKKWRLVFRQYLNRKRICLQSPRDSDAPNDVKQEGDVYFNQLRKSWT